MNVIGPIQNVINDLRERRLWPLAAALLLGIVAVPVVLAKSPQPTTPMAPPVVTSSPMAHLTTLPPVRLEVSLVHTSLSGASRDPFRQGGSGKSASSTSHTAFSSSSSRSATSSVGSASGHTGSAASGSGAAASSGGGGSAGAARSSSGSGGGTGGGQPNPAPAFVKHPHPGPSGLGPTQSYAVTVAVSDPNGNVTNFDLTRHGVLPNAQQPELVELGVLQGARRVLFAVAPSYQPSRGICIPGPNDCELLSIAPGDVETLDLMTKQGALQQEQFTVAGISASNHPSVAAARQARLQVAPAGTRLLRQWALPAQSMFAFRVNLDAMVDLRDLMVGGG